MTKQKLEEAIELLQSAGSYWKYGFGESFSMVIAAAIEHLKGMKDDQRNGHNRIRASAGRRTDAKDEHTAAEQAEFDRFLQEIGRAKEFLESNGFTVTERNKDTITLKREVVEKIKRRMGVIITIYQQTGDARQMRLNAEEALDLLTAALEENK